MTNVNVTLEGKRTFVYKDSFFQTSIDDGTNTAQALIVPVPTSTPTGGEPLDLSSLTCGTGNDNDQDGLCDSWETPFGLEIPFGGATYFYPCTQLIDDTKNWYRFG